MAQTLGEIQASFIDCDKHSYLMKIEAMRVGQRLVFGRDNISLDDIAAAVGKLYPDLDLRRSYRPPRRRRGLLALFRIRR